MPGQPMQGLPGQPQPVPSPLPVSGPVPYGMPQPAANNFAGLAQRRPMMYQNG